MTRSNTGRLLAIVVLLLAEGFHPHSIAYAAAPPQERPSEERPRSESVFVEIAKK